MTWRSVVAATAVAGASVLGSACGGFDYDEARDAVRRVGVERMLQAADSLTATSGSGPRELPAESWPQAFRDLRPEAIYVGADGVELSMSSFYVEGENLFIAFRGATPPEEGGADPAVRKVAERIYWMHYTG